MTRLNRTGIVFVMCNIFSRVSFCGEFWLHIYFGVRNDPTAKLHLTMRSTSNFWDARGRSYVAPKLSTMAEKFPDLVHVRLLSRRDQSEL